MNMTATVVDFVESDRFDSLHVSPIRGPFEGAATGAISLGDLASDEVIGEGIVGRSRGLRHVIEQVEMVAPTDATVLICGETGTGKELIARAVHNLSGRRAQPYVKCNLAAIPTGLLESELFGHEKGAFTSAVSQRVGRFELANRGTIFLDEIGEAPLELQPKLLRVLQEREFERLGSSRTLQTDARLVTATNVDLPGMVDAKRFRADLYYRLNVFPIHVPSLRERPEDIPALVKHFARHFARRMGRRIQWIASTAMDALVGYAWPGNIRELQNLIERAVIRSTGERLEVPVSEIDEGIGAAKSRGPSGTLEDAERAHILSTLKATRWTVSGPHGAAKRLGINRSTLQFRMKKLGIRRPPVLDEASA
jgi:formate hydrogenlyase transcriptional activator